ncbi:MAG: DNA polymerase III subunit gamma/tau [Candidatus Peregrinibacteria bacterium]|nr:DNA polymerase III subunit gamma/tau [Candidatus Peregrinibacteria bacterium]MDZ4244475.1 DNA polymerase III subunit gamma/tau [Candidatus Gracilibacteria bacterium]
MSLYLKYRPQDFDNLVGQDHIIQTLINALKEDRVSHAYLFCGPRGTGKTSMARLIAKAINCLSPSSDGGPCNECDICVQINDNRLTDIIEIDAASNRGIDPIRELREKISFSPNTAKYKIYIIDEVHMLTKEAFNALLKTLEEPPAHAYFILATTEIYKVPDTIISRCQRFDFHRMAKATLIERLAFIAKEENVEYETEALECIAERVNGGMRDAIGLLEQSTKHGGITLENLKKTLGLTENQSIIDLFDSIYSGDMLQSLKMINDIHNQGFDLEQMSKDFLEYCRKQMLIAVKANDTARIGRVVLIIDKLEDAKSKIKNSSLPQLALEIAAIKLCGIDCNIVQPARMSPIESEEYETTLNELESSNENDFLSKLRKNWNTVVAKIKKPAIRTSFKDAKAVSIKDNTLLLHFSTQFHLEKSSTVEALSEIENAIEEMYNQKLSIKMELRKVDLTPTVKNREHSGLESNDTANSLPDKQTVTPSTQTPADATIEESPEDAINVFESW